VLDESQGEEKVEGSFKVAVVREKIAFQHLPRCAGFVEELLRHLASGRGVVHSGYPAPVGKVKIGKPRRLGATDLEHRTPGRPLEVPPEERVEPPVGIVARIVVTGALFLSAQFRSQNSWLARFPVCCPGEAGFTSAG